MNNFSSEMIIFNDVPPPKNEFNLKDAWEIKERKRVISSSELANLPPMKDVPTVDQGAKYEQVAGAARYLVEKDPFVITDNSNLYKAWDRRLGKMVLVKVIGDVELIDDANKYKMELEAKTLAKFNHPGIPRIWEFNTVDTPNEKNKPALIMDFLEGQNLKQRILDKNKNPLTIEEVTTIISQVGSTLDFVNQNELSHADTKPRNIILTSDYAVLVDWGISTWVSPTGGFSKDYSAPEQHFGRRDITGDVYNLAATAFEVIFGTMRPEDIKLLDGRIDRSKFNYDFTKNQREELKIIFNKAFAFKSADRYQTATEFTQDFSRAIQNAKIILQ